MKPRQRVFALLLLVVAELLPLHISAAEPTLASCNLGLEIIGSLTHKVAEIWKSLSKRPFQIYRGRALRALSSEAFRIFNQHYHTPETNLASADREILQREGVLPLFESFKAATPTLRFFNYWRGLFFRSEFGEPARKSWRRIPGFASDVFLSILTFPPRPRVQRAHRIFAATLRDEDYDPSQTPRSRRGWFLRPLTDVQFLELYNLTKAWDRFSADLLTHRDEFQTIQRIRQVRHWLKLGLMASIISLVLDHDRRVKALDEDTYSVQDNSNEVVELMFTDVGLNAAIRFDTLVYNFGGGQVKSLSLSQWKEISGNQGLWRIELHLSKDERDRLMDYLDKRDSKTFPSLLFYNYSVSEVNRALEVTDLTIPPIIDHSQALTTAYLRVLSLSESSKVGRFTKVDPKGFSLEAAQFSDSAISLIDSSIALYFARSLLILGTGLDYALK